MTFVRNILESCGLSKLWEHQTISKDVDVPKKINLVLKKQYENTFFNELNSTSGNSKSGGNKLRTYAKIKDIYEIEPYMSSTTLSIQLKRAIAQIRTSSHDLEIERGRRHRPNDLNLHQQTNVTVKNVYIKLKMKLILSASVLYRRFSELNCYHTLTFRNPLLPFSRKYSNPERIVY